MSPGVLRGSGEPEAERGLHALFPPRERVAAEGMMESGQALGRLTGLEQFERTGGMGVEVPIQGQSRPAVVQLADPDVLGDVRRDGLEERDYAVLRPLEQRLHAHAGAPAALVRELEAGQPLVEGGGVGLPEAEDTLGGRSDRESEQDLLAMVGEIVDDLPDDSDMRLAYDEDRMSGGEQLPQNGERMLCVGRRKVVRRGVHDAPAYAPGDGGGSGLFRRPPFGPDAPESSRHRMRVAVEAAVGAAEHAVQGARGPFPGSGHGFGFWHGMSLARKWA